MVLGSDSALCGSVFEQKSHFGLFSLFSGILPHKQHILCNMQQWNEGKSFSIWTWQYIFLHSQNSVMIILYMCVNITQFHFQLMHKCHKHFHYGLVKCSGDNNTGPERDYRLACWWYLPCFGFLFFDPLGLAQQAQDRRSAAGEADGVSYDSRQSNIIISVFTVHTRLLCCRLMALTEKTDCEGDGSHRILEIYSRL